MCFREFYCTIKEIIFNNSSSISKKSFEIMILSSIICR